jgi:hypothetical protein
MQLKPRITRLAALVLLTGALAPARALTGAWTGEMASADGERVEMTYTFSPHGALVLQVPSTNGMRTVEVGYLGQSENWLPPNGGVATGRVLSYSAGSAHFQATISISADRPLFDGVMQQERIQLSLSFQQQGSEVHAVVQQRTEATTVGGPCKPTSQITVTLHRGVLVQR